MSNSSNLSMSVLARASSQTSKGTVDFASFKGCGIFFLCRRERTVFNLSIIFRPDLLRVPNILRQFDTKRSIGFRTLSSARNFNVNAEKNIYILLERKCVAEDASVGGNMKNSMSHKFSNFTALARVSSSKFSLQGYIIHFQST